MSNNMKTREKQTRLDFTPIQSPSPQRHEAHIRVDETFSPTKKRKVGSKSSPHPRPNNQPPPFSQSRVQIIDHSPARTPTQLPTPLASSQPEAEPELESSVIDQKRPRTHTGNNNAAIEKQDITISSEENEDDDIVTRTRRRPNPIISLGSKDEDPQTFTPESRRSRKSSSNSTTQPEKLTQNTPRLSKPRNAKSFLLGGASGAAPISHSQRHGALRYARQGWRTSSESSENAGSDNTPTKETPMRDSKRNLRSSTKPHTRVPPQRVHLDLDFVESESDHPVADKSSNNQDHAPHNSQDSTDSDSPNTPIRRRGKLVQKRAGTYVSDDDSDLQAEVADLQDSDASEDSSTRARSTAPRSERKKRLSKLEELKRRRAGLVEVSDDESQAEVLGEDDTDTGEINYTREVDIDLDEYEKDFIEDGGDEAIGVDLARGGVPLELTRYANLKPFEYFKYTVEWMIHAKLNPAFERNDEVYHLALKKLDDEVKGHAGSTYTSPVWNLEFREALMSRPDIFRVDIPNMLEHKCDACNRSGHPAKHKIILTGNRYDKITLERISVRDSDSSSDISSSSPSNTPVSNEDEAEAEEPDQTFLLGRFCCANVEIAHALYHWRYQLNQTILEWLSLNGHMTPEKILERENWSGRRRQRAADRVVDRMVENGEMRELYAQFKVNLEAARSARPDRVERG